jgi:hypothetical protein
MTLNNNSFLSGQLACISHYAGFISATPPASHSITPAIYAIDARLIIRRHVDIDAIRSRLYYE